MFDFLQNNNHAPDYNTNSDFDLGKVVILQRFRGQKQLLIITIIIFLNVIDKYTLYFTLIICSIVIGQYNLTVGYRMEHLQSISYTSQSF